MTRKTLSSSPIMFAMHFSMVLSTYLLTLLLFNDDLGGLVAADSFLPYEASTEVKLRGSRGTVPVVSFSGTIIEDGTMIEIYCMKPANTEVSATHLVRINANGKKSREFSSDWSLTILACGNYDTAVVKRCEGNKYQTRFTKDKAGLYYCSLYPEDQHLLNWIGKPKSHAEVHNVTLVKDFNEQTYEIPCKLNLAPTDMSYTGLLEPFWHHRNLYGAMTEVKEGGRHTFVIPAKGTEIKLRITNFNGWLDGGDYRCGAKLRGEYSLESDIFKIRVKAKAQLSNDLRGEVFVFGVGETAVITCKVVAFPKVDLITLTRDNEMLDGPKDLLGRGDFHYTSTVLTNISAADNNTILWCRAKRNNIVEPEDEDYKTIYVTDNPPPTISTDDTSGVTKDTQLEAKKAWVIAVAVIVPVFIILAIIAVCCWCRRKNSLDEEYYTTRTHHDDL